VDYILCFRFWVFRNEMAMVAVIVAGKRILGGAKPKGNAGR
jgi:hypothetical protein